MFGEITWNPNDIKTINRLLTGHTYDSKYVHRINSSQSNIGDICGLLDYSEHQILKCTKHNDIRSKFTFL